MSGALVVVATPIGNLGDLSPRATEELAAADVIACEDTRRTGRLLEHAGVSPRRLVTVNDHTETVAIPRLLAAIEDDGRVALVSDAGTPGISDPGERLVAAAAGAGHLVLVIPGPSAAVAALVASGLPTGRFCFEGFLPRKGKARRERIRVLADEPRTMIVYEAPHRLARTLADLAAALGADRSVAVARELTKLHEEVVRETLGEAATRVGREGVRGEVVLVIAGAPPAAPAGDDEVAAAVRAHLAAGASARDAAGAVATELGVPRRRAYGMAHRLDTR